MKYPNKRFVVRRRGRFAKTPSLETMGLDLADSDRRCQCGHVWRPILVTGRCPECGAQNSRPVECLP